MILLAAFHRYCSFLLLLQFVVVTAAEEKVAQQTEQQQQQQNKQLGLVRQQSYRHINPPRSRSLKKKRKRKAKSKSAEPVKFEFPIYMALIGPEDTFDEEDEVPTIESVIKDTYNEVMTSTTTAVLKEVSFQNQTLASLKDNSDENDGTRSLRYKSTRYKRAVVSVVYVTGECRSCDVDDPVSDVWGFSNSNSSNSNGYFRRDLLWSSLSSKLRLLQDGSATLGDYMDSTLVNLQDEGFEEVEGVEVFENKPDTFEVDRPENMDYLDPMNAEFYSTFEVEEEAEEHDADVNRDKEDFYGARRGRLRL